MFDQQIGEPLLRRDLERLREQITEADELRDASALASAAAKASGARIVAITFGNRQVLATPTGTGMGNDGTPTAPQVTAEPNTPQVQLPVTFDVEYRSGGRLHRRASRRAETGTGGPGPIQRHK